MDKFFSELSTLYWWLSVFTAGFLINIFSSYVKGFLDSVLSFLSTRIKNNSEQKRKAKQQIIQVLVNNKYLQMVFYQLEHRHRLRALIYSSIMVLTIILIFILSASNNVPETMVKNANTFLLFICLIGLISYISASKKTQEIEEILIDVYKAEMDQEDSNFACLKKFF